MPTMRLLIYSDLHLEFSAFNVPSRGYDAVVLAGDIGVGTEGISWALEKFESVPVIYVFGNHEFYHHEVNSVKRQARRIASGSNVHVLDNETISVEAVDFVCATLWTDFDLFGDTAMNKLQARYVMNDYRLIRYGDKTLLPDDTHRFHLESRSFFAESLSDAPSSRERVVVTHHAPSARSLTGRRVDREIGYAYASALDELVEQSSAALWIHGHTHEPVDYRIGDTRVISNPRGYALAANHSTDPEFSADCIVEI